jgi:class 3 adenylate cyclase
MDVSTWLRDLGLGNYAQAFRANDIDAEVLSRLTAEDLIALGITSVGHRRKLLDAIALRHEETAPAAVQPTPTTLRPIEAERRQLTVMFVDLVGSTELAARLDPEDMGQVIRAYHESCATVINRWDGHVAKYMGDGVLAYFGWPRAHEDDAERAVRAGLELAEAVGRLGEAEAEPNMARSASSDRWVALRSTQPTGVATLAARVGIATGLVMVGEVIGEGVAQEQTVVGETPNLAARLQALAAPGVSSSARRPAGSWVACSR